MTAEQRRALALLTSDQHGATEALMLAHGFERETLAGLVLAGLATVTTEGATPIKVERYRITDAGRAPRSRAGRRHYARRVIFTGASVFGAGGWRRVCYPPQVLPEHYA